jgi:SAM-dependent methyltransferase
MPTPSQPSEFDQYAQGSGANYDAALNQGLALSGESKDFFIEGRLRFLQKCLAKLNAPNPQKCLDYGCGTGAAFPQLQSILHAPQIIGIDISAAELALAQKKFPWAKTFTPDQTPENLAADLAYSNGTFHHIPPSDRQSALAFIHSRLRPSGLFALWENNPFNPGTRWVMSRIPFDKNAITLSPRESRRRLRNAGFQILRTDFLFYFPKSLRPLRPLEKLLTKLPLGAQYQILAQK